jgi:TonB family protein
MRLFYYDVKNQQTNNNYLITLRCKGTAMKILKLIFSVILVSLMYSNNTLATQISDDQTTINKPIQIIERTSPVYPTLALAHQIEGWVKVIFTVTAGGDVVDLSVVEASPPGVFDAAALSAVKKFKISPPIKNGAPTDQRVAQTIEFELPNDYQQRAAEFDQQTRLDIADGNIDLDMMQTPDDLQWLITSVVSKSKIKLHERSLKSLDLAIETDSVGQPVDVLVMTNEFDDLLNQEQIDALKREILFYALKNYQFFNGYYNPNYSLQVAKNKPASVVTHMVAESMPIPDLRLDQIITADLTIDENGHLIGIENTFANAEPIDIHTVQDIFKVFSYNAATYKYKKKQDTIEVSLTMTLVQKDHIESIKSEYIKSL